MRPMRYYYDYLTDLSITYQNICKKRFGKVTGQKSGVISIQGHWTVSHGQLGILSSNVYAHYT